MATWATQIPNSGLQADPERCSSLTTHYTSLILYMLVRDPKDGTGSQSAHPPSLATPLPPPSPWLAHSPPPLGTPARAGQGGDAQPRPLLLSRSPPRPSLHPSPAPRLPPRPPARRSGGVSAAAAAAGRSRHLPPPSARAEPSRSREPERDWSQQDRDGGRPRRRRTGARNPGGPARSRPGPVGRGTLSPPPRPLPRPWLPAPPPPGHQPSRPRKPRNPGCGSRERRSQAPKTPAGLGSPARAPFPALSSPFPRRPRAPLARRLPPPGARTMLKSRLRMFLNELKLLVLTGGGRPRAEPQPRGGGGGGCGWAPFAGCSTRDGDGDEEEYYGSEPRARGLAGDKEPRVGPPPPPAPPPPPPGALDALSLSSSLDSGLRTPQCRICFQGPEQGELLSPCRCDGSVRCTHQPCLIRWISERGSWSCELCYFKYQVLAISTKNPLQWQAISLTVIEKVQIAAIVLGSLFLVASISWLIWSSLSPSAKWQRQDLLFQICYGMYGFMDVVCIGLIVHEGSSVYRIFKRWQAVNQQWKVLNYDKTKDIGGDAGGGTAGKPGPRTSRTGPPSGATSRPLAAQRMRTLLPQRCGYTILHLLGQLRPPDARSSSHSGREVVMRVTTV
ncbi:E3 ubiquitin-protein ligase MARCHF9 [Mustela lutreola]|uniref:E3 ubiquitin-protein ligase MARCHF9 n=1 Tax=Mustela lutreola TaxID=9666 RepID=UPI00279719E4|nr:E3 ubiquitin-protein ligase MARCHF9 [Mustela lutreola]